MVCFMADAADLAVVEMEFFNQVVLGGFDTSMDKQGSLECEECGEEIAEERREKAPWATQCVDCLSLIERKQRHFRKA